MVVAEVVDLDYPLRLRKMDRLRLKSVFKAAPKAFGTTLSRSRGMAVPLLVRTRRFAFWDAVVFHRFPSKIRHR